MTDQPGYLMLTVVLLLSLLSSPRLVEAREECSPLQCAWSADGLTVCFVHGEVIYVGAVTLTCEYGSWRVDW